MVMTKKKREYPNKANEICNSVSSLFLSQIRRDGGTQPRASINHETVRDYAEDMKNGDKFPPVIVFYDGEIYWLADGFHRIEAALGARKKKIAVTVKQGTRRDAVLYSVGANAKHGLRRSNLDKRRAVMTLLEDEEWNKWSNREIARKCGVSEFLVRQLRDSHCDKNAVTTYTTKHGTTAQMNTANIGKGKSSESPLTEEDKAISASNEEQKINTSQEEAELTTPTNSEENNFPSDIPPENEERNIRKLLSDGDRVRINNTHHCGGQFGIVTFIPNRNCAVIEFSPGKREVIQYEDFDFTSVNTPPQPPVKKEIIIQEGLNYKVGNPGYGCKWYVEVSEQTYKRLQNYQEKVGTPTIDSAIDRFLEIETEKEKTPNSDDIVLYFISNVQQLPRERVNLVLEAFAKTHYDAFAQTLQAIKQKKTLKAV